MSGGFRPVANSRATSDHEGAPSAASPTTLYPADSALSAATSSEPPVVMDGREPFHLHEPIVAASISPPQGGHGFRDALIVPTPGRHQSRVQRDAGWRSHHPHGKAAEEVPRHTPVVETPIGSPSDAPATCVEDQVEDLFAAPAQVLHARGLAGSARSATGAPSVTVGGNEPQLGEDAGDM